MFSVLHKIRYRSDQNPKPTDRLLNYEHFLAKFCPFLPRNFSHLSNLVELHQSPDLFPDTSAVITFTFLLYGKWIQGFMCHKLIIFCAYYAIQNIIMTIFCCDLVGKHFPVMAHDWRMCTVGWLGGRCWPVTVLQVGQQTPAGGVEAGVDVLCLSFPVPRDQQYLQYVVRCLYRTLYVVYTVHSTLYIVYIVHCTLYVVYIVHCT